MTGTQPLSDHAGHSRPGRRKFTGWLVRTSVWRLAFVVLLVILAYLSFKPSPAIQGTPGIPSSLAEWFDLYDQWKNLLGFAAMGFAGFMGWPEGLGKGTLRVRSVRLALLLCGIIVTFELIQIPIPSRWCDPKDMIAGSAGVWLAWSLARMFRHFMKYAGG